MKKIRVISKFLSAILVAFGLVFTNIASVNAVDIPDYRLQVSPPTLDLNLTPGRTSTGSFKVQNTGAKAYDFIIGVTPYSVTNENYTPDYDTSSSYTDIVNWVTFSQESGHVEPGEEVEIVVTVNVPRDVPSGGQYAMIYAQLNEDAANQEGMNIAATKRVGIILYSEVAGNTRRTAEIIENSIPTILFNPPVIATSTIRNTGNVHGQATYTIEVYPLFSSELAYSNSSDPTVLQVLPESTRFNTVSWGGAPRIGIFRVKQTITIFGETSTVEKIVFLCPIWFLIIVLILIVAIIYWFVSQAKKRGVKTSEAE